MSLCTQCGDQHNPTEVRCPRTQGPIASGGPCGLMVDRYRVEKLLGQGGMGSVYLARHSALGQMVALKLLRPELAADGQIGGRFLREAQSAAAIQHPHIVRVTDFGTVPSGEAFLVMELLSGHDLDKLIERTGAVPLPRAMHIMQQVLDALGAAHAAGIVHRDMKPANVFLINGPGNDPDYVKLVDFGISKLRNDPGGASGGSGNNLTRTGMAIGTPAYMPPEQIFGSKTLDHRADIYASAVMLFEMLTARRPFDADTYEKLILQVVSQAPRHVCEFLPNMPRALGDVIQRGMAREPEHRFSSAKEFADALAHATAGYVNAGASVPPPAAQNAGWPAPATQQPMYASAPGTPPPAYPPAGTQPPMYASAPGTPPPGNLYPPIAQPPPGQAAYAPTANAPPGSSYPSMPVSQPGAPMPVATPSGGRGGVILVAALLVGGAAAGLGWYFMNRKAAVPPTASKPVVTALDVPVVMVPTPDMPMPRVTIPTVVTVDVPVVRQVAIGDPDGDTDDDPTVVPVDPNALGLDPNAVQQLAQAQAQLAQAMAMLDAGGIPTIAFPPGVMGNPTATGTADAGSGTQGLPPPSTGIEVGEPDIVGHGNVVLVKRRLQAISGAMDDCRARGQEIVVQLDLFAQANGGVSLVTDGDENKATPKQTQCMINRVKAYYGIVPGGPQGIVTVEFTLHPL